MVAATSAPEALRLARELRPDLIVSDLHMPGATGYDLIKAVRADSNLHAVPFIFLASTPQTQRERDSAVALGALKFLMRPIDPGALLAEIDAAVGARGAGE